MEPRITGSERQPEGADGLVRVNLMLSKDLLRRLEKLALDIRENSGAALSRSEIVRGTLDGLMDYGLRPRSIRSEKDIRRVLRVNLERLVGRGRM